MGYTLLTDKKGVHYLAITTMIQRRLYTVPDELYKETKKILPPDDFEHRDMTEVIKWCDEHLKQ